MRLAALLGRGSIWARYSVVIAALSLATYGVTAWAWPWRPGRVGGLLFGIVAALLFVNAALYPWRRKWNTRPLGTAQRWLQLHIYGSVLAMLFVILHIGFRAPAGMMGWLLLLLSLWTTTTGLIGVWLQRSVPRLLVRRLNVEAIYERIPDLVRALAAEADALMAGSSDALARAYAGHIRPGLDTPRPSWQWLTRSAPTAADAIAPIARVRPFAMETERARLDDLESILQDKSDLDAQLSLQRILRTWLIVHVPPAILLMGLLATHVIAVVLH